MFRPNLLGTFRKVCYSLRSLMTTKATPLLVGLICVATLRAQAEVSLLEQLKGSSFKIAHECYVENNWEIFVMNADGSNPVNLTQTPKENEHYPQVSPDGTNICFSVDTGEGREAIRSLYVMDIDGSHRRKLIRHD